MSGVLIRWPISGEIRTVDSTTLARWQSIGWAAVDDDGDGQADSTAAQSRLTAVELAAARLGVAGDMTVAVASDSTANDTNDWVAIWAQLVAAARPSLRVEHIGWTDASQTWAAAWVVQAGAAPTTVALRDTFTRSGEIVGSTTDDGRVWSGSPTGIWSGDGSSAGATGIGSLTYDCGSKDLKVTAKLKLTTTATGTLQALRFYLGGGLFLSISISTTGVAQASVYKGGSTMIIGNLALLTEVGVVNASATVQNLTAVLQLVGTAVTLTLTGPTGTVKTYTATLLDAEYTAQTTVSLTQSQGAIPGIRLDELQLDTAVATQPQTLRIYNGAVAGTTLAYQQSRVATMWPAATPIDVLIMAGGHNYGSQTAAQYTAALDAFLAAYKAQQPGSLVAYSSQNPEWSPAVNIKSHRDRQAAGRLWARRNGHTYIGAIEAFLAQTGGGQSLVGTDGVHPTTPSSGTPDGYGSVLWAKVWDTLITNRISTT